MAPDRASSADDLLQESLYEPKLLTIEEPESREQVSDADVAKLAEEKNAKKAAGGGGGGLGGFSGGGTKGAPPVAAGMATGPKVGSILKLRMI